MDTEKAVTDGISAIPDISLDDAKAINDAVVSLVLAKATVEDDDFIAQLLEAITEEPEISDLFSRVGIDTIQSRLKSLFSAGHVALAAKAASLMYEYDNVYTSAKILSDVRPIFNGDLSSIDAGLIIHTLRIHYHTDQATHKDFYVAMDNQDLDQLIDVLTRAKLKAEKLRSTLTSAGIPHLDTNLD